VAVADVCDGRSVFNLLRVTVYTVVRI